MGRPPSTPDLTPRQRDVLALIRQGHTNQEIADILGISLSGAKWHVSELLGIHGVRSRDELAEARRPRWWRALWPAGLGLTGWKGLAGGGVIAGGLIGAALVVAITRDSAEPVAEMAIPAAATSPAPTAPTATLPAGIGAKWTPQEALAEAQLRAESLVRDGRYEVTRRPDFSELQLQVAEWHPSVTRVELAGGDVYWVTDPAAPRDAWLFTWGARGFSPLAWEGEPTPDEFRVIVLLEDGASRTDEPLAFGVGLVIPGNGMLTGSNGGFSSKRLNEMLEKSRTAVTSPVRVAWLNGVVGGPSLAIFQNGFGEWVTEERAASDAAPEGPPANPTPYQLPPDEAVVMAGAHASVDPRDQRWTSLAWIFVARLTVATITPEVGGQALGAVAMEPQPGLGVGFAYLAMDELPAGASPAAIEFVARDASGREIGRVKWDTPPVPPAPTPGP